MSASEVERRDGVELGEVVIRLRDRGPEPAWHEDRRLYGTWRRFEAELESYPAVREAGSSPWEAVRRLVSQHRGVLERRWSPDGLGPMPAAGCLGGNNSYSECSGLVSQTPKSVRGCWEFRTPCCSSVGEVGLWVTCGLVGP